PPFGAPLLEPLAADRRDRDDRRAGGEPGPVPDLRGPRALLRADRDLERVVRDRVRVDPERAEQPDLLPGHVDLAPLPRDERGVRQVPRAARPDPDPVPRARQRRQERGPGVREEVDNGVVAPAPELADQAELRSPASLQTDHLVQVRVARERVHAGAERQELEPRVGERTARGPDRGRRQEHVAHEVRLDQEQPPEFGEPLRPSARRRPPTARGRLLRHRYTPANWRSCSRRYTP